MILRTTDSVCPVCRRRIPAEYVERGDAVYMEKSCPQHGPFSTPVWRGAPSLNEWWAGWDGQADSRANCPEDCGLCAAHKNTTCCAILDVTTRCNLGCPVCFASSGAGTDMPLPEVLAALGDMYEKGIRFLHFSGGEATVRDDLPEIVAYAAKLGYEYLQLNTNGLRLAREPDYAGKLSDAGLSSVFLQFDGTDDEIYRRVRGRPLLGVKQKAIEHCDAAALGVVLVPTLIPGVNDRNIGAIAEFALERLPAVKGVHFQPVTYTGRYPEGETPRITFPEVLTALEEQTGGKIRAADFLPSACDAPMCGFHGEFRMENGVLRRLPARNGQCCGAGQRGASRNQKHVKNRWTRMKPGRYEPGSIDACLQELNDSTFCISAMAFQDLGNLDFARVMECSVHVYEKGKLIPFCVYHNLR